MTSVASTLPSQGSKMDNKPITIIPTNSDNKPIKFKGFPSEYRDALYALNDFLKRSKQFESLLTHGSKTLSNNTIIIDNPSSLLFITGAFQDNQLWSFYDPCPSGEERLSSYYGSQIIKNAKDTAILDHFNTVTMQQQWVKSSIVFSKSIIKDHNSAFLDMALSIFEDENTKAHLRLASKGTARGLIQAMRIHSGTPHEIAEDAADAGYAISKWLPRFVRWNAPETKLALWKLMNQSFKGNINTRSLGAWLDDLNELLSLIGQGIPTPNTIVNKIHDIGLNDTILCNFYAFLLRDAKTDIINPSLAIAFMQNVMCLADSNGNVATWPSSNEEKVILRRDKHQLAYNISKASLSKDEIYIISDSGINHEDMIITNAIVLAAKLNLESPYGCDERNNGDFSINSAVIELLQPKKTHGNISLTLPLWVEGIWMSADASVAQTEASISAVTAHSKYGPVPQREIRTRSLYPSSTNQISSQ